jgi:Bacterial PH domain
VASGHLQAGTVPSPFATARRDRCRGIRHLRDRTREQSRKKPGRPYRGGRYLDHWRGIPGRKRGRTTIDGEGLSASSPFGRRSCRWSEVDGIRLDINDRGEDPVLSTIKIDLHGGRTFTLAVPRDHEHGSHHDNPDFPDQLATIRRYWQANSGPVQPLENERNCQRNGGGGEGQPGHELGDERTIDPRGAEQSFHAVADYYASQSGDS